MVRKRTILLSWLAMAGLTFTPPSWQPVLAETNEESPARIGFHGAVHDKNGKPLPWTPWDAAIGREMDWHPDCSTGARGRVGRLHMAATEGVASMEPSPNHALPNALPLKPPRNGGLYVIAHRGAHNGIPENTLPAYEKAIELGVDFVEVDVRTTKDGEYVSIHNDTVGAYVEGAAGRIRDLTLEELRALDVGARIGPQWRGTRIPTFLEVLDLCKGRCGIWLDLKDAPIRPLVDLIKSRGMEHDVLWCISPKEVPALREASPECVEMPDPGAEANLPRVIKEYRPRMVCPVWRDFSMSYADTCHAAGVIVFVDERDPDSWADAIAWGADGIQTDHPAALIEYLKTRDRGRE